MVIIYGCGLSALRFAIYGCGLSALRFAIYGCGLSALRFAIYGCGLSALRFAIYGCGLFLRFRATALTLRAALRFARYGQRPEVPSRFRIGIRIQKESA